MLPFGALAKVCTGIAGELIQANKALVDNPGLMSEDVSYSGRFSRTSDTHCYRSVLLLRFPLLLLVVCFGNVTSARV